MGVLGSIFTAIWLILFGVNLSGWAAISDKFLGVAAIIVGIVILLEMFVFPTAVNRPAVIHRRVQ